MNHVTIVTGFGRCGSSLVMQMLEAGGHPISGDWPSFEDRAAAVQGPLLGGSSDCMEQFVGHAVKVLDLHTGSLPRGFAYRAIWCTRDHREQGKSQAKFLTMMAGIPLGRDAARQFERSYGKDHPKLAAALNRVGADVLHLRFEDLLMRPVETAQRIAVFLGLPTEAVGRMAAAVVPRNARCAPGLDMELQLLAGRERTAGVQPSAETQWHCEAIRCTCKPSEMLTCKRMVPSGVNVVPEDRCPDCYGSAVLGEKRGVRCAACNGTGTRGVKEGGNGLS